MSFIFKSETWSLKTLHMKAHVFVASSQAAWASGTPEIRNVHGLASKSKETLQLTLLLRRSSSQLFLGEVFCFLLPVAG